MITKHFISPGKECKHIFTAECIKKSKFLSKLDFKGVLGEGLQGVVLGAVLDNTNVAVKIVILNQSPVTMTTRVGAKCNSLWFKVPGMKTMIKSILEMKHKNKFTKEVLFVSTEDFEQEVKFNRILGSMGISPNLFMSSICKKGLKTDFGVYDVGILVLEKYDCTLHQWIRKNINANSKHIGDKLLEYSEIVKSLRKIGQKMESSKIVNHHGDLHANNIVLKLKGNDKSKRKKYKVALIDFGLTDKRNDQNITIEIEELILETKLDIFYFISKQTESNQLVKYFTKYLG